MERDGRPISGYGLHSFPAYCGQLDKGFNEAPETSLYDACIIFVLLHVV